MMMRGLFALVIIFSSTAMVSSRQDIMDTSVIKGDGHFTVTCNAGRAGVTSTDINRILIHRMLFTQTEESLLAQYLASGPQANREQQNVPSGREWDVTFTGAGGPDMTVTVSVRDATCSDAGLYKCEVGYIYSDLLVVSGTKNRTQSITCGSSGHGAGLALTVFVVMSTFFIYM